MCNATGGARPFQGFKRIVFLGYLDRNSTVFERVIVVRPPSVAETPCAVSERHRFFYRWKSLEADFSAEKGSGLDPSRCGHGYEMVFRDHGLRFQFHHFLGAQLRSWAFFPDIVCSFVDC